MPKYTESIHTLALVGHGGAGKTTLAEALLWKAGAIASPGSVEKGTTVCDFDPHGEGLRPLARVLPRELRLRGHAHPPHRHARHARLRRPVDRRAGRRGDRGRRDQRAERHRAQHHAHDEVGEDARPVPHDRGEQDRRGERGPARAPRARSRTTSARSACPSTCRPTTARTWSTASSLPTAMPTSSA